MAQNDEFREVYAASGAAFVHALQLAITVATLMAEHQVRMREERYRREGEIEAERTRVEAEKIRAERAAAEPLLRAAHQDKFWQDLETHPERLGRTWQAAAEWAGGDPYAAFTLQHLREQLAERYGLTVPDWPVGGAEMARLITMTDPTYRKKLDAARAAAEEAPGTSYAMIVRDLRNESRIVHRGEVTADAGMSASTAAATAYLDWAGASGATLVEERSAAEIVVELVENTGDPSAAHIPAATLQGADAETVLAADAARLAELAAGTAQPETKAELLRALRAELDRLEQDEAKRAQRRADYAARLADGRDLSPLDVRRLEGNVEAITEGLDALHQKQADTALKLAALVAEMRGENPDHVYDAARLSENLDDGWWMTASAAEIGDLWSHVEKWDEGAARKEIRQHMRDGIERYHGLMVPKDASADMVSSLFGGADTLGPAKALPEQAEELHSQAYGVFEEAFDGMARANELDAQGPDSAEQARLVREQAEHRFHQGQALMSQAVWLTQQTPEVMTRLYAENSGEAVRDLHAEFARRWGQEPPQTTAEQIAQIAQAPAADNVWTVIAAPGSAPATSLPRQVSRAVPAAADAEREGPAEEETAADQADQEARRAAEAARRAAAEEALEAVADPEAVEAVRLADMAFPDGPEAVLEASPATSRATSSRDVQQQRERTSTLEM